MRNWIFKFGQEVDGNIDMKDVLGGKGANLAEMSKLQIPVPPGFTISAECCEIYYKNNMKLSDELKEQIKQGVKYVENVMQRKFADDNNPLLFSVRSGAKVSMPGMMDTILNLGINDNILRGLIEQSKNTRFPLDSYRRFLQMYGTVVLGIEHHSFESIIELEKRKHNFIEDTQLTNENLQSIIKAFKILIQKDTQTQNIQITFSEKPEEQLFSAIEAVFRSWYNDRAKIYRKLHNISENLGTAVNVQAMVFGNLGDDSATGVVFTRNPSNGTKKLYGEYLPNAQGEDVVAGIRTPRQITEEGKKNHNLQEISLEKLMPTQYQNLLDICNKLETHYGDMQDIEFTIEKGKLWMLQTRKGQRSIEATLKIAVDMVDEKKISKEQAINSIQPKDLDRILHPTISLSQNSKVIAKGLPAAPGAAVGQVVFSSEEAMLYSNEGKKVILVREETNPDDINGMIVSQAIVTSRGGMTSHAAVVARGMGKCCVTGAAKINIETKNNLCYIGDEIIKQGDEIAVDGSTGEIIIGDVELVIPSLSNDFKIIMQWSNQIKKMKVRANAETREDVTMAKKFGAEGIGLCRTEHMFFDNERIKHIRNMILNNDPDIQKKSIDVLQKYQTEDFIDILQIMQDLPVNIRLLDPPLHEFLPTAHEEMEEIAQMSEVSIQFVKRRCKELHETNPMLGHRGCRLAISYPEIYKMQVRAICEAYCHILKQNPDAKPKPEIMIPFVISVKEINIVKQNIINVKKEIEKKYNLNIQLEIGTMIELPRATLMAEEIVQEVDYFSFGTNDLTQTTMGISRDDSAEFMGHYVEKEILKIDPFVTIDEKGVGTLVNIACDKARKYKNNFKLSVCGEHGGDPQSIQFFNRLNFDYVSCSPFRIAIAKLAAAQATIKQN